MRVDRRRRLRGRDAVVRKSTRGEQRYLRTLGLRVYRARTARRWSQRELAARAGLSQVFVGSVERGRYGVDLVRIAYLARALDMSMADLVPELDLLDVAVDRSVDGTSNTVSGVSRL